jgi:hypothetical protein
MRARYALASLRYGSVVAAERFTEYADAKRSYEQAVKAGGQRALVELVGAGDVKVLLLSFGKPSFLPQSFALQVSRKLTGNGRDPFAVPIDLRDDDEQGEGHAD